MELLQGVDLYTTILYAYLIFYQILWAEWKYPTYRKHNIIRTLIVYVTFHKVKHRVFNSLQTKSFQHKLRHTNRYFNNIQSDSTSMQVNFHTPLHPT